MPKFTKDAKRLNPARLLVFGFLVIIAAGTILLWLPFSSRDGSFSPIFDCLFTATSATCVTGLTVVDTFSHWSFFGQLVIALLIQVGGLSFVTIITFFNVAAGKKLGFHTLQIAAGELSENSLEGGRQILVSIMKYSLIIELVGALILAIEFVPKYGAHGVWVSIFISISSFCNAGFDIMGTGASLTGFQSSPLVLITVALMAFVGGLGFIVWENFLTIRKTKKISLHSRVVLVTSGALVIGGTILYLIAEWSNPSTIGNMGFGEKLLNAFFSSVATRSVGFNSIPIDGMTEFSKLGTIFLMFVGSAPGSTGGGIKVTTLMVMIMTVYSIICNKNDVEIFGHKLGKDAVYRTLVSVVLSFAAVSVCFTGVYFLMPDGAMENGALDCLFDSVAVFSTAGLTVGTAAASGIAGRIILLLTMFAGRLGPVSVIMSLTLNSAKRKNTVLPEGQILIG